MVHELKGEEGQDASCCSGGDLGVWVISGVHHLVMLLRSRDAHERRNLLRLSNPLFIALHLHINLR